mgnify:FL=1
MNKLYNMFKGIALNAMASRTIEADPLQSFMFRVSIPGLPTGVGFQKVGGLSREVEVVEYLENMYDHTHKLPGRETVSDVTFERGMYADDYLQGIYEKVFNNNTVRNTVVIQICDRFGKIRREFKCAEAWFSKYECADLDATSSDVIIETLTMAFEYFL